MGEVDIEDLYDKILAKCDNDDDFYSVLYFMTKDTVKPTSPTYMKVVGECLERMSPERRKLILNPVEGKRKYGELIIDWSAK